MAYDVTYSFDSLAANEDDFTWDGPDVDVLSAEDTDGAWCWTNTGSTSSSTGPPSGTACVYTESSSPVEVSDVFTMTLVAANEVDASAYELNVEFDISVQGNTDGTLVFQAFDGTDWNTIATFYGDAVTTMVSKGPYDFGPDGYDYDNDDFSVRFVVTVGNASNTYHNDFAVDEINIYGEDKVTGGSYDQTSFRGREDDDSESAAAWIAAVNTNFNQVQDENFRIRFLIQEDDDVEDLNVEFQLQYNLNAGGWNDVNGSSSVVRSFASDEFTDGATTTQQIGSGTFVGTNNGMDEVNGIAGGAGMDFSTTVNQESEVEYCIQIRGADTARGDTIQLRVIKEADEVLDTYTNTPTITIPEGAGMVLMSAQKVQATAGAENPGTFDFEKSLPWGAISLALRFDTGATGLANLSPTSQFTTIKTTGTMTVQDGATIDGLNIDADVYIEDAIDLTDVMIIGDLYIDTGADSELDFSNVTVTGNVYNDATGNTLTINASDGSSLTAGDPGTGNGETNIVTSVEHVLTGLIDGSEVTYTELATAAETGTAGASSADSRTFTDSTQSWTTDEWKGHLLVIESGADAGRYYIARNTSTTLTLDAELSATASSLSYSIYDETQSTVEYHVESVTGNSTTFQYAYAAGYIVDILIFHTNYEDIVLEDITLGAADASVPIQQQQSLFYSNP